MMGAGNETGLTTALRQAVRYQAPEIIREVSQADDEIEPQIEQDKPLGRHTTVKGDIYAFGVTSLEVLPVHQAHDSC